MAPQPQDTPILDLVGKAPRLTEPRVWFQRIVIYESLDKTIRDIPFQPGLNIVRSANPPSKRRSEKDVVRSHGAGKTTLCRMIRHLLGEPVFGGEREMDDIREAFPEGYVAAELRIDGTPWGVLRPFDKDWQTFVSSGMTIEELIDSEGTDVKPNSYVETLGLDRIVSGVTLRNGTPARWEHLLPWFTRDEGTDLRYQNDWRENPVETGTPAAIRAEASYLIRSALGFSSPNEYKLQQSLNQLRRDRNAAQQKVEERKRTFGILAAHYRKELEKLLVKTGHTEPVAMLPDNDAEPLFCKAAVEKAKELLKHDSEKLRAKLRPLEERRDIISANISTNNKKIAIYETETATCESQKQEAEDRIKRENLRLDTRYCVIDPTFPLSKCEHIKKEEDRIYDEIWKEIQDQKSKKKSADKNQSFFDARIKEFRDAVDELKKSLEELNGKLKKAEKQAKSKDDLARYIESAYNGYVRQASFVDNPEQDETYRESSKRFSELDTQVNELEVERNSLRSRSTSDKRTLSGIFDQCVQIMFGNDYSGRLSDAAQRLHFSIVYNNRIKTSATYHVLSAFCADLASVIHNAFSKRPSIPGFFLYDSPKRFDMQTGLYEEFFRLLLRVQNEFATINACPFQYIITTTTPPPDECKPMECLELDASRPDDMGLLLKKNVMQTISNSKDRQRTFF